MTMTVSRADILAAKILIVDDQPINMELLEQLLVVTGYTNIDQTGDPLEVLELNQKNDYDLILLDLKMPKMDGFEVMEALKKHYPEHYLPVIVLTAEPTHKLRALNAGAKDFLSKPFSLVEVKTRIYNMLEVRLLYKMLANQNKLLEQTVRERTLKLSESEARLNHKTKLPAHWYWEQSANAQSTTISGSALELLGLRITAFFGQLTAEKTLGWNVLEQQKLQETIAKQEAFRDFKFSRVNEDGSQQIFQVSGEPMFNTACHFVGFRGIGSELTPNT